MRKIEIDEGKILSRIEKTQKKLGKTIKNDDETVIIGHENNDGVLQFSEDNISKPEVEENFESNNDILMLEEDDEDEIQKKSIFSKLIGEALDWAKHIAIAIVIGLLIVTFVIQRNEVIGSSMEPTLFENDQLLVQKVSKLYSSGIGYGDIITIDASGLPYNDDENNIIKRVIGLPGDLVEIKDESVFVNGNAISETYLGNVVTTEKNPAYSRVLLDMDEYYLLGDNRPISLDSRTFGPVEKDRIIGEVLFRFHPFNSFGTVK